MNLHGLTVVSSFARFASNFSLHPLRRRIGVVLRSQNKKGRLNNALKIHSPGGERRIFSGSKITPRFPFSTSPSKKSS